MTAPTLLIDPLRIRSILGRKEWTAPREFLTDSGDRAGWWLDRIDGSASVIVGATVIDGVDYFTAAIGCAGRTPDCADLELLHRAVFGDGYAYQVFPPPPRFPGPPSRTARLRGRVDGKPALPQHPHPGGAR